MPRIRKRHLHWPVHPDLYDVARRLPALPISRATLPILSALSRLHGRRVPAGVEALTLTSGVGVWLYRPAGVAGPGPALLWIHGGGYALGSPAQDHALCRRFVRELGVTVASVDYRLAPKHPYPAAFADCYAALTWLSVLPAVDPTRVAIGGASAGAGLAVTLALLARDRGVSVVAQLLPYPMLDDRTADRPDLDHLGHLLWTNANNRLAWAAYLGDADRDVAVPARRTDLAGLPPAWLGVGSIDLFHDEDLAFAERLEAAGVPCHVEVVQGAFHGFDRMAPKSPVSQSFFDSQCDWLRRYLSPLPVVAP